MVSEAFVYRFLVFRLPVDPIHELGGTHDANGQTAR